MKSKTTLTRQEFRHKKFIVQDPISGIVETLTFQDMLRNLEWLGKQPRDHSTKNEIDGLCFIIEVELSCKKPIEKVKVDTMVARYRNLCNTLRTQAAAQTELQRQRGRRGGKAERYSQDSIGKRIQSHLDRLSREDVLSSGLADILARNFKCSPQYVRRFISQKRKKRN